MTMDFYHGIDDAEIKIIPESVSSKLQERWKTKCDEAESLKIEFEHYKTNNEQRQFELQRDVVQYKDQYQSESKARAEFEAKTQEAGEKISDKEKEVQHLTTKLATLHCQLQIIKSESDSVCSTSTALSGTLETKSRLIQDLKAQIASLESQISGAMRSKAEAQIQSEEATSLQNQLQHKEKYLSQERGLLRGQVELLQEQLGKRVQEALQLRNDHNTALLQLQQDLYAATTECRILKEGQEQLEKSAEEKAKRVDELLESLRLARENELRLEENFRMELTAQQKLATIYQTSSTDYSSQCTELERGVSELRTLLEEASQQYGVLERSKEQQAKVSDQDLEKREELIQDLRDELDKVNMLLEANAKKDSHNDLFALTPAAAAASQLMSKGLTLSQLYAEHLTATDKLNKLDEENNRLTRYIDQILQEIEERAPILQKQREEYLIAMETVVALQQQLDDSSAAARTTSEESGELGRRCKYLVREHESLTAQNGDLNRQVTVLLTQVEAARAGVSPPAIDVDMEGVTTGGDVVSAHLVCFRDVSELQQQNQKLLHSIRELSDQAEQAEKSALDKYVHEIQAELGEAQGELEQLRLGRDRIEALVENISRQRDMYRSLLGQQGKDHGRDVPSTEDDSRPSSADASEGGDSQQLKEEVSRTAKELEAAKRALAAAQEDGKQAQKRAADQHKELHKQVDDARITLEKTRTQNVKLLSHAEYNEERLKTLQGNCESYQRQVNAVEEKNTTLQSIVCRHEATLEHLRGEHMTLVKKLSHAEVISNNLKEEKLIFKETEARLLAERESSSRQESSQALVLASLESIKNNLEHKDSSERMRTQNKIADLTDQNTRLKAKLEANTDLNETRTKLSTAEDRLKCSERERTSGVEHLTTAREQLLVLQRRYEEALDREKSVTCKLRDVQSAAAGGTSSTDSPATISTVRDLEVQLAEERARVSTLERSLGQAKKSLASLQTTCSQQEKELKLSTEASHATVKRVEELMAGKKESDRKRLLLEERFSRDMDQAQVSIDKLKQQLTQTDEDVLASGAVLDTLRTELDELKSELEATKNMKGSATKLIEDAQKASLAAQQKYEREVVQHGSDLQVLARLKEEQAGHTTALEGVMAQKVRAEETLEEVRRAGTGLQDSLKLERGSLQERITELEAQNNGLLEQFTQISDKMASIQNKLLKGQQDGNESFGNLSFSEDEARSSEQLREVIKYLRRERELATGKCDVAVAEAARVTAQLDSLNRHVEQLTVQLSKERETTQVSMDTATRYGSLMRKVHTVDALADSNRLLRQEKDALQEKADAAKGRAEALQVQVVPLNTKLAEALAEAETVKVEKRAAEKDVEMYKKRTQELVEKLNRAKPEDFMRMQQELNSSKSSLQTKEVDSTRLRMQVGQLQKNIQTMVTARQGLQQQIAIVKEEKTKVMDDNKKLSGERTRLVAQVGQHQERHATVMSAHQQEQVKQLEQRNQLLQQIGEVKQREEAAKRESDQSKKETETAKRGTEEAKKHLQEVEGQKGDLQKQIIQLRKIATKYKKASETSEEEGSNTAAKVKEFEASIATLKQQLEASKASGREQEDASRTKLMEAELTRVRQELESRSKETVALRGAINTQLSDITKKLDESNSKKVAYESRIGQLEKEKEHLSGQLETLSLKLNVQQRQIMMDSATRQKQAPSGISKPSTSGGASSEKSSTDAPPTANIKPIAAATPSVTMSSPRTTPIPTTPSRTIPTASIRPLAPPPAPGVGVVPPRDAHSEGLVSSSTVTLPQATVTPTPATPSSTLSTAATTTTTQSTASTHTHTSTALPPCAAPAATTLTATVSPTPVSTSMQLSQGMSSSSSSSASPSASVAAAASPSKISTATQQVSTVAAGQVCAVVAAAGASGSGSSSAAATPSAAAVATVAPQDQQVEAMDHEATGVPAGSDQLVSQAIAMIVVPGQEQQQQQQQQVVAGTSVHKRKRDGDEDDEDDDESKRSRVEHESDRAPTGSGGVSEQPSVQQEADDGTSTQQGGEARAVATEESGQGQVVILVDSDEADPAANGGQVQQRMEESEAEQQPTEQQQQEAADQEEEQEVTEAPSESHQPMHPQQQPSTNSSSNNNSSQQQPSSSSAGPRQAALILPRPSAGNDRVGSSGSNEGSLAGQHYDDGNDDSIVPSTPTLFAPRRAEGFPEPVSSPQRGPPRSPPASSSSETGVSTSEVSSAPADSAAPSQPEQGEPSSAEEASGGGNYTEADSMAAEVEDGEDEDEEIDEEEEEEEEEEGQGEEEDEENECPDNPNEDDDDDDDDDDIVDIADDEEQSREAQQQPGEAAQQKSGDDDVSSGGEEVSSGPSSSSYAAPSSSSSMVAPASPSSSSPSRRITPITWDRSAPQEEEPTVRGRGPYRSSDRILGRRQQKSPPAEPAGRGAFVQQQRSARGGQKARRSRQPHN